MKIACVRKIQRDFNNTDSVFKYLAQNNASIFIINCHPIFKGSVEQASLVQITISDAIESELKIISLFQWPKRVVNISFLISVRFSNSQNVGYANIQQ